MVVFGVLYMCILSVMDKTISFLPITFKTYIVFIFIRTPQYYALVLLILC